MLQDIPYTARGRTLDVYTPPHVAPHITTVAVFVYGGAWGSGDKNLYPLLAQSLVPHVAAVVLPNYTLHPHVRAWHTTVTMLEQYRHRVTCGTWSRMCCSAWRGSGHRRRASTACR